MFCALIIFFFFQAEDGIRDLTVTGVQTCALPISDGGETVRLVITVLRQTETVSLPGIGVVRARVVEERETVGGELVEVSRNLFAICDKTNDVFYFGEAVDIFNPVGTVTHDGSWRRGARARDGAAPPRVIMPRTLLLGSRYFQEPAQGVALARAEHGAAGL